MSSATTQILLVEDNPADARLIQEYLADADDLVADVVHVEHVRDAQRHLEREHVDVILLDLLLPDCHGVETVTQVFTAAPQVPIIVMSGLEDEAIIARAVEEGAQDYLIKEHVNTYLLVHAIRFAIERQRILNEKYVSLSEIARSMNPQRIVALEQKVERLIDLMSKRLGT